jgi:hypothetical protein
MIENIYNLDKKIAKNCDRDSEVKICLQPGLEAQKVEKHCSIVFTKEPNSIRDVKGHLKNT